MRKIFFWLIIVSLFIPNFSYSQYQKSAKKYVDTLTSVYMFGRGYQKNGDKKAAQFIESEFKKTGLTSIDGNYQQHYPIDVNSIIGEPTLKVNNTSMKLGINYIVASNSASGKGKVRVVNFDKFITIKNQSKYGVVIDSEKYIEIKRNPSLLQEIYKAKILLIQYKSKLTASLSQVQSPIPVVQILTNERVKKIDYDIEAKLLNRYVTQNVYGVLKGEVYPDSFLIVCAHYDHLGGMGNIYFPGANDNASGVSMLFELAKYYSINQHKYSMLFIAFGGEEVGLLGSKYFVENSPIDLKKVKFVINLDLMGTGQEGITVVNGKVFTSHYDRLLEINSNSLFVKEIKARGKAANSDHYYFTEAGVPAFFIYARGTPNHYHDIYDNGSDLNLDKFDEIVKLIIEFNNKL